MIYTVGILLFTNLLTLLLAWWALDKMWELEDALNSVCLPPGEDAEIGPRIGETKTKKP